MDAAEEFDEAIILRCIASYMVRIARRIELRGAVVEKKKVLSGELASLRGEADGSDDENDAEKMGIGDR